MNDIKDIQHDDILRQAVTDTQETLSDNKNSLNDERH